MRKKGLSKGTEKEPLERQEENQESVVSLKPQEDCFKKEGETALSKAHRRQNKGGIEMCTYIHFTHMYICNLVILVLPSYCDYIVKYLRTQIMSNYFCIVHNA